MPRGRRGNGDARGELVRVLSCGFTCFHVLEESRDRSGRRHALSITCGTAHCSGRELHERATNGARMSRLP